jgi:hypothetical protein
MFHASLKEKVDRKSKSRSDEMTKKSKRELAIQRYLKEYGDFWDWEADEEEHFAIMLHGEFKAEMQMETWLRSEDDEA